ncbi:hypothetical protein CWI36_3344p0010, partial [Hamiltosporidium magnivora]
KENKDFYLKLFNKEKFRNKVNITENFKVKQNNFDVECFYEYKGCFNNISITFKKLYHKRFIITENTILEENIKSIKISSSEIKSDFLRDIFNIKGLETLEIINSGIYIENEIFLNESIKYFRFWHKNRNNICRFFKPIDMMIGLQEIYFTQLNIIKLNRSVDQIFYIKELDLYDINEMIDFLKQSEKNEKFDFKSTNKAKADLKLSLSPLKFLFQNYEISSIKKLSISDFYINNSNVEAFSTLLSLKELKIHKIWFQNISFSELFLAKQEYKISRMYLDEINISEKDLIFIANLKKIEYIKLWSYGIQGKDYTWIRMYFYNEFYIELIYYEEDVLPEETIKYIKEKFKTKYIVIRDSLGL